jgi:hypothetical protein
MVDQDPTICRFYRLVPEAPEPRRADRSADGTLPVRAYRYCEAVASASGFGWYLYPPMNFSLRLESNVTYFSYGGSPEEWSKLDGTDVPDFRRRFAAAAPQGMDGLCPTFLTPSREPGVVQVWSGYLARTAPGWSLLSRGLANIPTTADYEVFEGIIETNDWFGPLFTNIRLTRTNSPVRFHVRYPLFQVQPVMRQCYRDPAYAVSELGDLDAEDWQRFAATMTPNTDQDRALGHYGAHTRRHLRREPAGG